MTGPGGPGDPDGIGSTGGPSGPSDTSGTDDTVDTEESPQRLIVRYQASSSGSGPLTLGQDNMIRCVLRDEPAHMSKQALWPVPEGTDLPATLAALRTLAERHPALRTVFPGSHFECQEERAEGEFTIAVVPVAPGEDLDKLAGELGLRDRHRAFDLARDFPLRFTLLTRQGRPVRLVVVVCHAHLDGAATALLVTEWLALIAGQPLPEPTSHTPREIAKLERSPAGRRRAKASLRHWEKVLRCDPPVVFAHDGVTHSDAQLPTLALRSATGAEALARAAERTGAGPSTLLLAAYAALVAHLAGQSTLVVAALSANRHRQALAEHIGTLAQDALLSLDTAVPDFDQLVQRTQAAALAAYWHSAFDAEQVWRLVDDTAHHRGLRYARHMVVNDLSATVPADTARQPLPPRVEPEFWWLPAETIPTRIMLNIWRTGGVLELTLHADPRLFPPAATEEFANALLRLLDLVAKRPVPLDELGTLTTLVPGRRERPGWQLIDGCWIDLAAVRELLTEALTEPLTEPLTEARGRVGEVTVKDGRLTAYLESAGAPLTPESAHAAVLAALPEHHTAMAPHHYVIRDGDLVLAEGSGRDPQVPDWQALLA
ncbi:condensation domain-containing protein [Kitasatospora sp. NBC_01287]|uniref:condensation domain-containing protein n=1 Tax=Kitasatospora sp. NBC_01287 TaxID=2903573 RepID=UPI002257B0BA|nr:condensation domain-containing protein [Kitasatospora sp. NBC_01287]MCX4744502.1 condensation domain-containing protein [Kitasatospora sp. NBC_01287]